MSDADRKTSDCLKSPNTFGQNSSMDSNSDDNVPLSSRDQTPLANAFINNNNININDNNNAQAGTIVEEALPLLRRVEEPDGDGTTTSNLKKKTHKPKKKEAETVKGTWNNSDNHNINNNNGGSTCSGGAASSLTFDQPSFPLFCRKCLGDNVGKKGERSDAFVVTCSKCGAHEVLLKADGSGMVKMDDPADPERKGELPTGNLMDAVWKSARDKVKSALKENYNEVMEGRTEIESDLQMFAVRLQNCSRQCADLYPLIITLRSLQLKKTSSEPQQRKTLETQLKNRLSALEDNLREIESFEITYLRPLAAHSSRSATPASLAAAERLWNVKSSSADDSTLPETKESTVQSNSSLFDPPPSSKATSPISAAPSTSVSVRLSTVVPGQASGGATATGNATDSAGTAATKTKPYYIERVEKLTRRLDVMHGHLTRYCMLQIALVHDRTKEAKAKAKRTEEEAVNSMYNFTQGLVDQCKGTTRTCLQKMEAKKKDNRKKERLLVELQTMAEKCIAEGDEAGLRQVEEMLRQMNLRN